MDNRSNNMIALRESLVEADGLSKRSHLSLQQRNRFNYLLSRISALKAGTDALELDRAEANKRAVEIGVPPTNFEREIASKPNGVEERAFYLYLKHGPESPEYRALLANNPQLSAIGTTGGTFVPLDFWAQVAEALAQTDPLLGEGNVSLIQELSLTTRPLQLPAWNLSTITSAQVGEGVQQLDASLITPSATARLSGGFMHRVSLAASFEIEEDSFKPVSELLARAYGVGFARGMGAQLVSGTGSGQPQGLLTAATNSTLQNASAGVFTLADVTGFYFALNRIYRASSRCAWVCNDSVYKIIRKIVDNQGRPLVDVTDDREVLLGKRVLVSPSMPNNRLVLGDLRNFVVRLSPMTIQRDYESGTGIGSVERGEANYHGRMRVDSALLDPSAGAAPPVVYFSVI